MQARVFCKMESIFSLHYPRYTFLFHQKWNFKNDPRARTEKVDCQSTFCDSSRSRTFLQWHVDQGDRIAPNDNQPQNCSSKEWYWDFGHALRRNLCCFMLKFSNGDGATYEKRACPNFSCVKITIIGLCGGGGCLDQNLPRTRLRRDWPFNHHFHVANVSWVLGTKSRTLRRCCEPVVRQALTQCFEHPVVAIIKCLKINYMYRYFGPGFLRCWMVSKAQTSIWLYEVSLLHYSDTFVASVSIHDKTWWERKSRVQ